MKPYSRYSKQQGAALIVSLVFMVILTLVALSSMHSSSFEIKVARSVKSQMDALTAAEDALANGESFIAGLGDIANYPPVSAVGFYQGASLASLSGLNNLFNDHSSSTATTSVGSGQFYVEYLGPQSTSGNSGVFGTPSIVGIRHLFRITGVGQLAGGQTKVVQSYFAISE